MILEKLKEAFTSGEINGKTLKQIFKYFSVVKGFEKDIFVDALNELEDEMFIAWENGKYVLFGESSLILGTLRGNERGFAFLIPEKVGQKDFFIPNSRLYGAQHGDKVLAAQVYTDKKSDDEAEVVRIVERGIKTLVGCFYPEDGYGFVRPDLTNYFCDIYIPFGKAKNAKLGDKVVVEITAYPENRKNPEGQIVEILGHKNDLDVELLSVIKSNGLKEEFSEEVMTSARGVADAVSEQEKLNREDFRNLLTVTIDGADARDFDDAISLEVLENSDYRLYVHIADVSHYVPKGSVIDKEAFERATSVYFPNKVLPMLPTQLSNGICSLNEGVDRLTMSAVMRVDKNGEVTEQRIVRGVIRSDKRMTYDGVEKMLNGDTEELKANEKTVPLITACRQLAEILIQKRDERGSINLEVKETEITYNKTEGISISPLKRSLSRRIIEEFMILANETVAEYIYNLELPCVYRIHEKPTEEKLKNFIEYIKLLGATVKWNENNVHSGDFQRLLEKFENSELYPLVNGVMLRSMSKAKYSAENVGHFGLASECYCHFTSPIRRYPDLVVHRVLKKILDGKIEELVADYSDYCTVSAQNSTAKEIKADEAERTADDLFKAYYMRSFIGERFDGIISGVTSFGVFVELPNTVEGLIKLESLPYGGYKYDAKTFSLKGDRLSFRLGDKISIEVANVDLFTRKVEFFYCQKGTSVRSGVSGRKGKRR